MGKQQAGLADLVILGLTHWAELQLSVQRSAAAQIALAEAAELAQTQAIAYVLPFLYTTQARYWLALDDTPQAQADAERALTSARAQGMRLEEGQALRVLAQVQLALHQPQAALDYCQQSLSLLATIPDEAARTQVVAGQAWLTAGDTPQSEQCLRMARATFVRLGAQRH